MTAPDYDDLPVQPELGLPCAWSAIDPNLGSLSFIGPEQRLSGVDQAQLGESFGLNLPLDLLDPPLFGRAAYRHRVIEVGRNTLEDVLDDFNPQSSSQWDGLRHVRAREQGFFTGITDLSAAGDSLGIEHWSSQGIVGRGVLLDVARWATHTGRDIDVLGGSEITAEDLRACARHQGVDLRRGDVLCIRTGWVAAYRGLSEAARAAPSLGDRFAGLRADEDMARLIWDARLGAVCADNPALESAPGDPAVGSLHRRLIPMLGTAVAELLDLESLAQRCAEIERWTFLFVAVPLPLPGGVSSPSNALAVL